MAELDVVREEGDSDANADNFQSSFSTELIRETTVSQYLTEHTRFAKQWFVENATPDMISDWLLGHGYGPDPEISAHHTSLTDSYARATSSGRNSVTSELFQDMVVCPKKKNAASNNTL